MNNSFNQVTSTIDVIRLGGHSCALNSRFREEIFSRRSYRAAYGKIRAAWQVALYAKLSAARGAHLERKDTLECLINSYTSAIRSRHSIVAIFEHGNRLYARNPTRVRCARHFRFN